MNSSGSIDIQGSAQLCLLVTPQLCVSRSRNTYRWKADPEGISEHKTLAREWCCHIGSSANHMADPRIAVEWPQGTARLALSPFLPALFGPTAFRAGIAPERMQ